MGLIAAESNGKSQDTEALYREHGAAVARLCHSLLRDRGEVEDATQQVFLSAHHALLNGAVPREPLPWLLTVARNECYARFRQRALTPIPAAETPEAATPDASVHVRRAGELASVWDEVGRMPPAQREAFLLREIRGLSYGQLADELSLSPPAVRSLLVRARTRLRQRLGEVAAGLGGAPWLQTLIRLVGGGEAASPLPAAAKAAAVGVGALALAGGGSLIARHASRTTAHTSARHPAAHVRHVQAPEPAAVTFTPGRVDGGSSGPERSPSRDGGSRDSGSGLSGSRDGSGDGSSGSGHDGSDGTTVAQQPTDGGDGGSSSSGSGSGSTDGTSLSGSGSDGGSSTSGSSSGSDGGSTSTTTTATTSSSDGSSSPDGSTSSDASVSSSSTDGGSYGG